MKLKPVGIVKLFVFEALNEDKSVTASDLGLKQNFKGRRQFNLNHLCLVG